MGRPTGPCRYWNYSDANDSNARLLPVPFRAATKPDGTPNGLFVPTRTSAANAGSQFADAADVAIANPLREPDYQSFDFGTGFGGPQTNFMHGGSLIGSVELGPHGSMHMAIGGWMQQFSTAALDPIFWLHHANIDRLWQVWLDRDANHANPAVSRWLTGVQFDFRDADAKAVKMSSKQVINSKAAPLSYSYEDTSDPLTPALAIIHKPAAGQDDQESQKDIDGNGWSDEGLVLAEQRRHPCQFRREAQGGEARRGRSGRPDAPRVPEHREARVERAGAVV